MRNEMKIKVEIPLTSTKNEFVKIVEVEISDEQMKLIAQEIAARLCTLDGDTIAVDMR